jgi:hypothetical protein
VQGDQEAATAPVNTTMPTRWAFAGVLRPANGAPIALGAM